MVNQKGQEFSPFVTVVPKGAVVKFQNGDTVQHNIYSFSSEEKLNFPLHGPGVALSTKPMDKLGEVELGCNIHDWMSAFLFVVDTPVFAISGKDGKAELSKVPAGSFKFSVWHPYLKDKKSIPAFTYKPGEPLLPLRLQVRSVHKPSRESY